MLQHWDLDDSRRKPAPGRKFDQGRSSRGVGAGHACDHRLIAFQAEGRSACYRFLTFPPPPYISTAIPCRGWTATTENVVAYRFRIFIEAICLLLYNRSLFFMLIRSFLEYLGMSFFYDGFVMRKFLSSFFYFYSFLLW